MLKSVTLRNVRNFRSIPWTLPLAPLTLICGSNSAGKSTILKSILFLKLNVGESGTPLTNKLLYTNDAIDLGSFDTFVSSGTTEEGFSISLQVEDEMPIDLYSQLSGRESIALDRPIKQSDDQSPTDPDMLPYILQSDFTFGYLTENDATASHEQDDATPSGPGPATLCQAIFSMIVRGEILFSWRVERYVSKGALKQDLIVDAVMLKRELSQWGFAPLIAELNKVKSDDRGTVRLSCLTRGLLPTRIIVELNEPHVKASKQKSTDRKRAIPLPFFITDSQRDLIRSLSSVKYIGPLRAPAKRYYLSTQDVGTENDTTGQAVPFEIRNQVSREITNKRIDKDARKETLGAALNYWLNYLRTGVKASEEVPGAVFTRQTADVLVELMVAGGDGDAAHALADSGFGYSQVLPILVSLLLARKGSTFLIEQPELHLNPSLQVRLADFFTAMALIGKQVIVETHSEHLVNALRVAVAEADDERLQRACLIYFISATDSKPMLTSLHIAENGDIPDWPAEFFGESLTLSSRLFRAQKRYLSRRARV